MACCRSCSHRTGRTGSEHWPVPVSLSAVFFGVLQVVLVRLYRTYGTSRVQLARDHVLLDIGCGTADFGTFPG
eukprot:5704465-Prymnesium_polylepis.1